MKCEMQMFGGLGVIGNHRKRRRENPDSRKEKIAEKKRKIAEKNSRNGLFSQGTEGIVRHG